MSKEDKEKLVKELKGKSKSERKAMGNIQAIEFLEEPFPEYGDDDDSEDFCALIRALLVVDPLERPDAEAALRMTQRLMK